MVLLTAYQIDIEKPGVTVSLLTAGFSFVIAPNVAACGTGSYRAPA